MALVKVIAGNLFAGANFQKLEVGSQVEASDKVAESWIGAGLAELVDPSTFEVATPAKRSRKKRSDNGDNND